MVNSVNLQSNTYALKDLIKLSKYANNVPITDSAESLTASQVLSYPAMLCGYDGIQWLKSNKGHYKQSFKDVVEHGKKAHELLNKHGVEGVLRVANAKEILANIPEAEALGKLSAPVQELYKQAKDLARTVEINADKNLIKKASSTFAKAKAETYKEVSKDAKGLFSKISKVTGYSKAKEVANDMAAKSSVFRTCKDAYDNEAGTFMLAINGFVEATSNVIPTFKQLGFKRGLKQLGRSAVKTVANVAGWVAGSALGTRLGVILGAIVGNSKVGSVVSAIAGKVGSYAVGTVTEHFANKAVTKVLGKSELEKAEEERIIDLAKNAQNNSVIFDELVQKAAERLYNEGEDNPEAQAINETLKNLVLQKQAMSVATSGLMSKEEMKAYADMLAKADDMTQVEQASATTQENAKKQVYTGYIPSAEAAKIKPETVEVSSEIADILKKTDRTINYCNKYVLK